MGRIQPSSSDRPYYARRSEPPPIKPRPTVQWDYSQANLHERDAEQQVLAFLSNQKSEMVQYSVPEFQSCGSPVTHEPIPSVPEEIKPVIDVVLRVTKHQSASSSKTPVQNSSDLCRGKISRETFKSREFDTTDVQSEQNKASKS